MPDECRKINFGKYAAETRPTKGIRVELATGDVLLYERWADAIPIIFSYIQAGVEVKVRMTDLKLVEVKP